MQYAGTRYAGWQVQPGQTTIQGLLQDTLARIVGHRVNMVGASRTDAGVHARGQVASARIESSLPLARLQRSLNALLPPDIQVLALEDAAPEFHALGGAVRREYRYEIVNAAVLSPFRYGFAYHVRARLDRARLGEAARRVLGEHDFAGFADSDRGLARTLRRVEVSEWCAQEELLAYRVVADGFVKGMVRALVGTFLDVARGRREPAWVDSILEARDRRLAGMSVPACGLYLQRVDYA